MLYFLLIKNIASQDIKEISHGLSTMVIALKRKKGLHEVYIQPNDVLQLGDLDGVKINQVAGVDQKRFVKGSRWNVVFLCATSEDALYYTVTEFWY